MKIVNLETFRGLPPNTLFSKYIPSVFTELQIKGDTWEHDFLVTSNLASAVKASSSSEFSHILDRAEMLGVSVDMDFESMGRDGLFDKEQLFSVWENKDVIQLIERLKLCVK